MAKRKAKFKNGQIVTAPIGRNDAVIGKIKSITYVPWQDKYHYSISGKRISDGYMWNITDVEESEIKAAKTNQPKNQPTMATKLAKFRIGQLVKDASGHDDKIHKIKSKRQDSRGNWQYRITELSGEFPEYWLKKAKRK